MYDAIRSVGWHIKADEIDYSSYDSMLRDGRRYNLARGLLNKKIGSILVPIDIGVLLNEEDTFISTYCGTSATRHFKYTKSTRKTAVGPNDTNVESEIEYGPDTDKDGEIPIPLDRLEQISKSKKG